MSKVKYTTALFLTFNLPRKPYKETEADDDDPFFLCILFYPGYPTT